MTRRIPLSALAHLVQESIDSIFYEETFWVIAELTDVKKYEQKRWCFLKFIEKRQDQIVTEMQGVFWSSAYGQILRFEQATGQAFANGLELSCRVAVRFHPRYGLKLEVLEIDPSFTLGQMELQRQRTLDRLLEDFPAFIQYADGEYRTSNKSLPWPRVMQRVALIAAPGSDGYRDFVHELQHNAYGYRFHLSVFSASVQGQQAVNDITNQLDAILEQAGQFDVVALVRGGGSTTDFAAFDDYEVAHRIARFPIPVFTGIGHDRNTSIADLMGCQFKTPTKVAAAIVDTALRFESDLAGLKEKVMDQWESRTLGYRQQLQQWQQQLGTVIPYQLQRRGERLHNWQQLLQRSLRERIRHHRNQLEERSRRVEGHTRQHLQHWRLHLSSLRRVVEQLDPDTILARGYALVQQDNKVIVDARSLDPGKPLHTIMKDHIIISDIKSIQPNE